MTFRSHTNDGVLLTFLSQQWMNLSLFSEFCYETRTMNRVGSQLSFFVFILCSLCQLPMAAQNNAYSSDAAFFIRLETDYVIQTMLFESRNVVTELERAGVLPLVARQMGGVPARPEPEDCIERYLAESVAKAWVDSAIIGLSGDAWVGQPCRAQFLKSSLYDEVDTAHHGFLREISLEFRELARMQGMSVAAVWFISEFAQIAAITVLTASGLGELALLAPVVPLSFLNTGIAIQVKAWRHSSRVRKGYGGRDNKRLALQTEKALAQRYHLNYRSVVLTGFGTDVIDTLQLAAIQDPSLMSRIFRGGRRNSERMYYGKLKWFLKGEGQKSCRCATLFKLKEHSRRLSTMMALRCLHDHEPATFASFEQRFPEVMIDVPGDAWLSAAGDVDAKEWVYYLLTRDYPEELRDALARVPKTLTVREVCDLLERLVYPYWARTMKKADFSAFRRMVKGTRSFVYATLDEQNRNWSFGYTQRLLTECRLNDFGN